MTSGYPLTVQRVKPRSHVSGMVVFSPGSTDGLTSPPPSSTTSPRI